MERVVVYPGKLPIVYDRNSVWEGEPPEQGSEDAESIGGASVHPLGNDAGM